MKLKLLLLFCIAAIGLSSCEKETLVQDTPNRTIILDVQPDEWEAYENGKGFTVDLPVNEIDQFNVEIEGILVYLDHPANTPSYIQLPYVYSGVSYSYEHYNGGIALDIQAAEFATMSPNRPTAPIRVKIVLIPSRDVT
jgi:hypothetical protein